MRVLYHAIITASVLALFSTLPSFCEAEIEISAPQDGLSIHSGNVIINGWATNVNNVRVRVTQNGSPTTTIRADTEQLPDGRTIWHVATETTGSGSATIAAFGGGFSDTVTVSLDGTAPDISRPRGIFLLGLFNEDLGTSTDAQTVLDLPWVSGYTLRVGWSTLNPEQGDFEWHLVREAVNYLTSIGKSLNIEVSVLHVPDWVVDGAAETWERVDPNAPPPDPNEFPPPPPEEQPVPWDDFALTVWEDFMAALAGLQFSGQPLTENSALAMVAAPIVGISAIRDLPENNVIFTHENYSRFRFRSGVLDSIAASRSQFGDFNFGFVGFFAMDDGLGAERLDANILNRLRNNYNNSGQPSLGFFQENLGDNAPDPARRFAGENLETASDDAYIVLQAVNPYTGSTATSRASGSPATALSRGYQFFDATFFELNRPDLSNADYQPVLEEWANLIGDTANP